MTIALIIPCYNEALTIAKVIQDFKNILPEAVIYVCDNNSKDNMAEIANQNGAIVIHENHQGKGHAVRRLFLEVEADIYIMVDGDTTYEAKSAVEMIELLQKNHLDMVVGKRVQVADKAYPAGHQFGNWMFNQVLKIIFNSKFEDIFSGYRVFSKRFVKTFPIVSAGFDIETEISVHALALYMPIAEIATPYYQRPEGSFSKLSTFSDGFKIMFKIIQLFKNTKPLLFFSCFSLFFLILSFILGLPILLEFLDTHLVPKIPTVISISCLLIFACLSFVLGVILDMLAELKKQNKQLFYLGYKK